PSGSLLVLVKLHTSWVQLDVNAATGGWLGGGGAVTGTGWATLPVASGASSRGSVTAKVPPALWGCAGSWVVTAAVPHSHPPRWPAIVPSGSLLVLVKLHTSWVQLDVNAATGGWLGGAVTLNGVLVAAVSCDAVARSV